MGVNGPATYLGFKLGQPDCKNSREHCIGLVPDIGSLNSKIWEDMDCSAVLCPLCELDL